jgi:hypothetical protein
MRHERVGVMIARGDLAVACGYERLAEAQEEILALDDILKRMDAHQSKKSAMLRSLRLATEFGA